MTIDLMWGFCSKKWTNKKINFVKLKTVVHYIPPPPNVSLHKVKCGKLYFNLKIMKNEYYEVRRSACCSTDKRFLGIL